MRHRRWMALKVGHIVWVNVHWPVVKSEEREKQVREEVALFSRKQCIEFGSERRLQVTLDQRASIGTDHRRRSSRICHKA